MSTVLDIHDLRERCRINEETGCWLWPWAKSKGEPRVYCLDPISGEMKVMIAARAAWLMSGKKLETGQIVYRAKCNDPLCISPHHRAAGTKAEWGRFVAKTGRLKGDPARVAINRLNAMAWTKVTAEIRLEILMSPETGVELAKRFGLGEQTISRVRRGKRVAQHIASSVFEWRPAQLRASKEAA